MNQWINLWWVNALLAATFAALTTVFAKIGVSSIDSNLATAIRTIVILFLVWSVVFVQGNMHQVLTIPTQTLTFLGLSGLATGLSWLFYFRALQTGQASFVASIDKLSLVFILLLSAIFLKEPLRFQSMMGISLIAIGTIVLTFK